MTARLTNLIKSLLHKRPATHPLSGPNGLVFQAIDKAELIANSLALQFTPNPGQPLPEVTAYIAPPSLQVITRSHPQVKFHRCYQNFQKTKLLARTRFEHRATTPAKKHGPDSN
jgi:hypothetical protein